MLGAALLACVAGIPLPCAAQTTIIRGTVRDSLTGRPLVAAMVEAGRRDSTDDRGAFTLGHVPSGEVTFGLFCPTRTMRGKNILLQRMRLVPGTELSIDLRVDTVLCDEPEYREFRAELRGLYARGFEWDGFRICADSTLPLPRDANRSSPWSDAYTSVYIPPSAQESFGRAVEKGAPEYMRSEIAIYVRWTGTFRGPGQYGHLGLTPYAFTVDSVAFIGPARQDVCVRPPER